MGKSSRIQAKRAEAKRAEAARARSDAAWAAYVEAKRLQARADYGKRAWTLVHDEGVPLQQAARQLGLSLPQVLELLAEQRLKDDAEHYERLRREMHRMAPPPPPVTSWSVALRASRNLRAQELRGQGLTVAVIAERLRESHAWVKAALSGWSPPAGYLPPQDEDEDQDLDEREPNEAGE